MFVKLGQILYGIVANPQSDHYLLSVAFQPAVSKREKKSSMSFRKLFSRTLVRPGLLRYYTAVVEGPSEGQARPLLARASLGTAEVTSEIKPRKSDLVIERKVLAYPPPHYFDTHKVISQLQQAGINLWFNNRPDFSLLKLLNIDA